MLQTANCLEWSDSAEGLVHNEFKGVIFHGDKGKSMFAYDGRTE
jgi:hypothetical protein